ncbi:hypothetical protein ASF52_08505 [Methylobacterium sp. Leaf112]|nr:hypothetical protein ASF52_08505 [Methylobacterium sp. Leaf112]
MRIEQRVVSNVLMSCYRCGGMGFLLPSFPTFCQSMTEKVHQRIQTARFDIGIRREIPVATEAAAWISPLFPSMRQIVLQRGARELSDIGIGSEVKLLVESRHSARWKVGIEFSCEVS